MTGAQHDQPNIGVGREVPRALLRDEIEPAIVTCASNGKHAAMSSERGTTLPEDLWERSNSRARPRYR